MPIRRVWVYLCGVVGNTLLYVAYVYIIIVVCIVYPYSMRNICVMYPWRIAVHRRDISYLTKMGCFYGVSTSCGFMGDIYLYFIV